MSGDLTGEATSRSLVNSVSKQMTKGIMFIDNKLFNYGFYTESSDCSAHPLNGCLLQVSYLLRPFVFQISYLSGLQESGL